MFNLRRILENVFKNTAYYWLWITFLIIFLDRLTKDFSLHYLEAYVPHPVYSFFSLTLAFNKGAAFSFLDHASGWQTWFFGLLAFFVSIGILIGLKFIARKQQLLGIALCLILGGALGNLWDRIHYGYVIDFLDFHYAHF